MREGVEGGFTSVSTLTGVTDAAKSESRDRSMVVGIVDGGTTRGDFVEDCVTLDKILS
jgi:hypothetical protein